MTPKERQAVHGRKHYDKKKAERATWSAERLEEYNEQTAEYNRRYCANNKEQIAEASRNYYVKKKAERATWSTEQQEAYKEQHAEYNRRYGANNKEQIATTNRKHYAANKAEAYRRNSERSRFLRNYKTTDFDKFVLEESWLLAREREAIIGGVWHVDHIIPVKHRKACGLNAAINLQVVPAEWNLSKGNRSMSVWLPKPSPNEP